MEKIQFSYEFPAIIDGTFARMRQNSNDTERYGNCRGANMDFGMEQYDSNLNGTVSFGAQ